MMMNLRLAALLTLLTTPLPALAAPIHAGCGNRVCKFSRMDCPSSCWVDPKSRSVR
jgi:hypothetical protein